MVTAGALLRDRCQNGAPAAIMRPIAGLRITLAAAPALAAAPLCRVADMILILIPTLEILRVLAGLSTIMCIAALALLR